MANEIGEQRSLVPGRKTLATHMVEKQLKVNRLQSRITELQESQTSNSESKVDDSSESGQETPHNSKKTDKLDDLYPIKQNSVDDRGKLTANLSSVQMSSKHSNTNSESSGVPFKSHSLMKNPNLSKLLQAGDSTRMLYGMKQPFRRASTSIERQVKQDKIA